MTTTPLLTPVPTRRFPALRRPGEPLLNRHVAAARQHTLAWLRQRGILDSAELARIDGYRLERYSARIVPTASQEGLALVHDWVCWGTVLDDRCEVDRPELLNELMGQLGAVLDGDRIGQTGHPLAVGLGDLRERTLALSPADDEYDRLLRTRALGWLRTYVAEAGRRGRRKHLSVERYLDERRWDSGMPVYLQVTGTVCGWLVSPLAGRGGVMDALSRAVTDHVSIVNDIYGVDRDLSRGTLANVVVSLEREHGLGHAAALAEAVRMANDRLDLVEILAPLCGDLDVVRGYRDWIRGNHDWHDETTRYFERGPSIAPIGQ